MYSAQEIKEAGLDDFRVFLIQVWDYLGLPAPTPVQLDIAYWLQHGPSRAILQAFRGVGKSWITVAFVLWHLLLDPQKKILVVSASQQLADDFSKFCKQLIHGMPLLQHLAPREGQRDSAIAFDVGPATPSKDPSVKSAGISGQITGTRADIIIADDIEIPKNSLTHTMREKLAEAVKEFDAILKPKEEARVIYLGTPQIEQSLYNRLEPRGYRIQIWPAEIPARLGVYRGRLAPFVQRLIERGIAVGTPIDPVRFSRQTLTERRLSYGSAGYALQFMLDTSPADAERNPLKCHDLIVMDVDMERAPVFVMWGSGSDERINDLACGGLDGDFFTGPFKRSGEVAEYTGTVMAIDPSGQGKDETAYAIVKYLHGVLYCVESGGFLDGFGEKTLQALAGAAARWHVNDVIDETNYGGGMFRQLLKPHLAKLGWGAYDEEWKGWSSAMKEHRICDVLQPVMENHKLVLSRRVIENDLKVIQDRPAYSLIYQMSRMAREKDALAHEDRLDALAMAVAYYTDRMNRDQKQALAQHREELQDAELRKFMDNAFGVKRAATTGYLMWR